jgi:tetratricopeptide (TPR) repeat protein
MKARLFIIALFGLALAACHKAVETRHGTSLQPIASPELSAIDSLMWQRPDSALAMLLPYFDTSISYDHYYAHLLLAELLYKNDSAQTNRAELQQAVAYFDSLADTPDAAFLAARAHYINGVGYYEMDSAVQACKEYLKALEIMEERFEEKELIGKKAKFMALTYTHLTGLFSDFYLHEQAIYFGKQALEYYQKHDATPWHIAWILNEIGSHYEMMDNYDSADFYYHKSLSVVSDTNSLIYRDIATRLAYLSYKKGGTSQPSLYKLHGLLSQAESEKEFLSRCLLIGEIFYLEQQYDSAWPYFAKVYERTESVDSKKLAAKRLLEICTTKENDSSILEYTAYAAQFATASEDRGVQNSELTELYRQYGQNKAERIHVQRIRKITIWIIWIVGTLVVLIILILVFYNIVRNRNKKLLAQKQAMEKQLKSESYSHKMKQEAIGGRLKKSNEELRLQKEETENLRKILETNQKQAKWNHLDDFINEDICKEITASLGGKQIKREAKSNAYPELHLNNTQLLRLSVAVEKHFPGFGKMLTDLCPKINRDEMSQCLLYLLDFEDVQIAALLSCDYSTVKKRSLKLKKAFGTEKELHLFIREFVL